MIAKRLVEWTLADLERLQTDQVSEDAHLEFKSDLAVPGEKRGTQDSWHHDQKNVGDAARYVLAKEIIAFANSGGGVLVLGMNEIDDSLHPNSAGDIKPLPQCRRLADVLRNGCRDLIEPKLERIEFHGLATQGDGSGVVLISSIPQSRLRPHRHTKHKECYVRRGEAAVPMTMDEIKDLTLYAVTLQQRIDEQFATRITQALSYLHNRGCDAYRIQFILIPLQRVEIPGIYRDEKFRGISDRHEGTFESTKDGAATKIEPVFPFTSYDWRPILRGMRSIGEQSEGTALHEMYEDGSVVTAIGKKTAAIAANDRRAIYHTWILGMLATALQSVRAMRTSTGMTELAYGLHFEMTTIGRAFSLLDSGQPHSVQTGELPSGSVVLPRLQTSSDDDLDHIMTILDRDLWNSVGIDPKRKVQIKWD